MKAPRGLRNNNPGNLRLPASQTRPGDCGHDKDGFSKFSSPEYGLDSLARQLVNYGRRGLKTVAEIMGRYSPQKENDTYAYIMFMANSMRVDVVKTLDMESPEMIAALMTGIIRYENGRQPYTRTTIFNSAQRALQRGVK